MDLNLATIYPGPENESRELRLAMLKERFEEVGYWVEFHPVRSIGRVLYRSRLEFNAADMAPVFRLLERRTGKKVPLDPQGRLPWRKVFYFKSEEPYYWDYTPSVKSAGIQRMGSCSGEFAFEVYAAEAFAKDLAAWLDSQHEQRFKWVCIEATKLKDDE
jgi:hypothetical protein